MSSDMPTGPERESNPERLITVGFGDVIRARTEAEGQPMVVLQTATEQPGEIMAAAITELGGEEALGLPGGVFVDNVAGKEGETWDADRIRRAMARGFLLPEQQADQAALAAVEQRLRPRLETWSQLPPAEFELQSPPAEPDA